MSSLEIITDTAALQSSVLINAGAPLNSGEAGYFRYLAWRLPKDHVTARFARWVLSGCKPAPDAEVLAEAQELYDLAGSSEASAVICYLEQTLAPEAEPWPES